MSTEYKHTCHACGGHVTYPADAIGQTVQCPHCEQITTLGESAADATGRQESQINKRGLKARVLIGAGVLALAVSMAGVWIIAVKPTARTANSTQQIVEQPASAKIALTTPVPAGLIHRWRIMAEELIDVVGGTKGTWSGKPAFMQGNVGLAFRGVYEVADTPDLSFGPNTPMSVELWAFRTGNEDVGHLLGKRSGGEFNYLLCYNERGGKDIRFGGPNPNDQLVSKVAFPKNSWVHLAATFDGSTIILFLNGAEIGRKSRPLGAINSHPLRLGTAGEFEPFPGFLDEIGFYSRALTPMEVEIIYNSRTSGKRLPIVSPEVKVASTLAPLTAQSSNLVKPFSQPGQRWTNSLGQVFAPVSQTSVLFCIWKTRVKDFKAFADAAKYDATKGVNSLKSDGWKVRGENWKNPGFSQTPEHPVCGVNWEDAQAFCHWLTEQERSAGRLTTEQSYRLPTNDEWSKAVGLEDGAESSPDERAESFKSFSWGKQWPPPAGTGNYAGSEARDADFPADFPIIAGYRDDYARTSPVGSFKANQYGLYDVGGNLWEWCEDGTEQGGQKRRRLRGGSFLDGKPEEVHSAYNRNTFARNRYVDRGFRCVVVDRAKSNETVAQARVSATATIRANLPPSTLPTFLPDYILNPPGHRRLAPLPPARRPYLNVLVRFSDSTGTPPHPPEWYHRLITDPKVGLNQFYKGLSGGQISFDGTQTTDWITLPKKRLEYCTQGPGSDFAGFDINKLFPEITRLLKGTNFGAWFGVIIYTSEADGGGLFENGNEGLGAWVGLPVGVPYQFRKFSGQDSFPFAVIPPRGANLGVVAHEVGHNLGFQHSSGPYNIAYDSDWDFMSRGRNRASPDPEFGTSPVGTIAYHLLKIGWLARSRVYYADKGAHEVRLERLSSPTTTKDPLVIIIPIDTQNGRFYTVEARMFAGNDQKGGIPGEAVVIHDVDQVDKPWLQRRYAQVVDVDNNKDPNDAGAMWTKGKTYRDSKNGVSVSVLDRDATGFRVRVEVHRP